jgi:polysaccharide biosynthesis protein PslF
VHNVPVRPTQHQHAQLVAVVGTSHCTIVMSNGARQHLIDRYAIDPSRVVVIPHGGSIPDPQARHGAHRGRRHPQLLTWGPLGPGRGIEHVIDALTLLGDLRPRVQYTVAGNTHPDVSVEHGDQHRNALIRRAWAAGVVGSVTFDDAPRRPAELDRFVASAKVVVLPYESRDHIASPVLVGAIAAGLPVIATAFPHAAELLSGGAGLIVPHADPMALAEAIRSIAHDDRLYQTMAAHARDLAPRHSWTIIADQYLAVAERLVTANAVYT